MSHILNLNKVFQKVFISLGSDKIFPNSMNCWQSLKQLLNHGSSMSKKKKNFFYLPKSYGQLSQRLFRLHSEVLDPFFYESSHYGQWQQFQWNCVYENHTDRG